MRETTIQKQAKRLLKIYDGTLRSAEDRELFLMDLRNAFRVVEREALGRAANKVEADETLNGLWRRKFADDIRALPSEAPSVTLCPGCESQWAPHTYYCVESQLSDADRVSELAKARNKELEAENDQLRNALENIRDSQEPWEPQRQMALAALAASQHTAGECEHEQDACRQCEADKRVP